jgi:hypothetical protein
VGRVSEDLGAPVAHLALKDGVPVFDRTGRRVGVVDRVLLDEATGIFEGIVIHAPPLLPGRHMYAGHEQIDELRERGVVLSVDAEQLAEVGPPSRRRRGDDDSVESPLAARLRKAWDRLTGMR